MSANTDDDSNWIRGWSVDPLDGPHGDEIRDARAEQSHRRAAEALEREARA